MHEREKTRHIRKEKKSAEKISRVYSTELKTSSLEETIILGKSVFRAEGNIEERTASPVPR